MRAVITIDMDGEAFAEGAGDELARILGFVAERVRHEDADTVLHHDATVLRDVNGNAVGELRIEDAAKVPPHRLEDGYDASNGAAGRGNY